MRYVKIKSSGRFIPCVITEKVEVEFMGEVLTTLIGNIIIVQAPRRGTTVLVLDERFELMPKGFAP